MSQDGNQVSILCFYSMKEATPSSQTVILTETAFCSFFKDCVAPKSHRPNITEIHFSENGFIESSLNASDDSLKMGSRHHSLCFDAEAF